MGDATNSGISISRTRSFLSTNSLTNSLYELTFANSIVSASPCSWKSHPTNSEYLNLTNSLSRTHSNERNQFCTQVFGKSLLIEIPSHELYIGLLYIGLFYWSLIYASSCIYIYMSLFIQMGLFFADVRLLNMKIFTLSQPHELTQLTDSHELNRPSHRSLQVSAHGPTNSDNLNFTNLFAKSLTNPFFQRTLTHSNFRIVTAHGNPTNSDV